LTFGETLTKAVHDVVKGCPFFGPSIGKKRPPGPPKPRGGHETPEAKAAKLTSRESDVLRLLAGGAANSQVAAKLSISIGAVEKHLLNLMGKLKIDEAVDLARFAIPACLIAGNVRLSIL
jgi:DNA-binding NarL/FixJ family response regulator